MLHVAEGPGVSGHPSEYGEHINNTGSHALPSAGHPAWQVVLTIQAGGLLGTFLLQRQHRQFLAPISLWGEGAYWGCALAEQQLLVICVCMAQKCARCCVCSVWLK